jgi:hypothetical protein
MQTDDAKRGWYYIADSDTGSDWWRQFPIWPDVLGQVLRLRYLISLFAAHIVTIIGFLFAHVDVYVIIAFAIPGLFSTGILFYVRHLLAQHSECDSRLHELIHNMRDRLRIVVSQPNNEARGIAVADYYKDICERIARYFQKRTGNPKIGCCIRVMDNPKYANSDQSEFVTVARSAGLAEERASGSEPIKSSQGIVKAFLDKNSNGAFRIDDMAAAEKDGIWVRTRNEIHHNDIGKILVCPINGYFENKRTMMGLLYLVDRRTPIQQVYWDAQKAIADNLGMIMPYIYDPKLDPKSDPKNSEDSGRIATSGDSAANTEYYCG